MSKSSQFVGSNQTEVIGHSRRTRLLPRPRMGRFYVERAGGRRFDVIVAMDLHAHKYLKAVADGERPDELLYLPSCQQEMKVARIIHHLVLGTGSAAFLWHELFGK